MPSDPQGGIHRLFPTSHRLLLERCLRPRFRAVTGDTLVIGAGHNPYGDWIPGARLVITTDIAFQPGSVNQVADAHALPFRDSSFDHAIAIEVVEHLEHPSVAISEIFRVLRPNGVATVSVPFCFHIHGDPMDFTRFTKRGLEVLFSAFQHVEVVGFGARVHTISDVVTTGARPLAALRVLNHVIARGPLATISSEDCPSGYLVEARR